MSTEYSWISAEVLQRLDNESALSMLITPTWPGTHECDAGDYFIVIHVPVIKHPAILDPGQDCNGIFDNDDAAVVRWRFLFKHNNAHLMASRSMQVLLL